MNTVSIVGVGLIGGSFAMALREAGFKGRIIGVSSASAASEALKRRIINEVLPLPEAAAQSDLVYLSRPIEGILSAIDEIDAYVRPGTLITDAGSTKTAICARAGFRIKRGRFVGGHPMAGKEARGAKEAEASLFRRRPYILTSPCAELETWIEKIGALLVIMSAEEHDRLVALTSHLPQLISTSLANVIGSEPDAARVAGPAAHDFTRLALSPYQIWRDIFSTNAKSIDAALDRFIVELEKVRRDLQTPEFQKDFEAAVEAARRLRNL